MEGLQQQQSNTGTIQNPSWAATVSTDAISDVLERLRALFPAENGVDPFVMQYLKIKGMTEANIVAAQKSGFFIALNGTPLEINERIKSGVGEDLLKKAGLMSNDGNVRMLPGHPLVFPLVGGQGAIFWAIDGSEEKLIHGIGNLVFHEATNKTVNRVIVCEGPMETMACLESGYKGSVIGIADLGKIGDGEDLVKAIKASVNNDGKVFIAMPKSKNGSVCSQRICAIMTQNGINNSMVKLDEGTTSIMEINLVKKGLMEKREVASEPVKNDQIKNNLSDNKSIVVDSANNKQVKKFNDEDDFKENKFILFLSEAVITVVLGVAKSVYFIANALTVIGFAELIWVVIAIIPLNIATYFGAFTPAEWGVHWLLWAPGLMGFMILQARGLGRIFSKLSN